MYSACKVISCPAPDSGFDGSKTPARRQWQDTGKTPARHQQDTSVSSDGCGLSWGSGRGLLEVYWGWTDAALSWGSGRGLLEVYQGWTDAASAGDLEEVY